VATFVAAQHAGRERPRHLQLAGILGGDLLELSNAGCVISVGITQSFGFCDILISSSFACAAPAAKTATAPKQVVSKTFRIGILPATVARLIDTTAHAVSRRHPFDGKNFRQRVTAQRGTRGK
jgi:hypothetical protein